MKNFILTILLVFTTHFTMQSQNTTPDGFESLLLAAESDSKALVSGYLTPALKGMNHSLNGGWYHTAKTHKKFGFDITITGNFSFAPSSDELFSIAGLNNVSTVSENTSIPTVVGPDVSETLKFEVSNNGVVYKAEVQAPGGIGDDLPLNAIPSPMVQFAIGLPIETDLIVRYMPTVNSQGVKASLFGFGFKYNILQHLGPIDKLPLDISVLGAYSNMSTQYDLEKNSSIDGDGQQISFSTNTFTLQALASIDLLFIDFYAGLGYGMGSSSFNVLGTYELEYQSGSDTYSRTLTDPISTKIKSKGARATIGTRLNLLFFKIFADYTLQEYNTFTAGIAFSFR